jgi:acetyl-CoA carboxylase carboxyl transferase subunit beta
MNWISDGVLPKIKTLFKREAPDNLWIKCPDSGQLVFQKDVEANQWVIPGSEHHLRMKSLDRLRLIFDEAKWLDVALPEVALDPLRFRDEKRYVDRLRDAKAKTSMQDAFRIGFGRVEGNPMTIAVQDFDFMGGSLGMAAGDAFIKRPISCSRLPGVPACKKASCR